LQRVASHGGMNAPWGVAQAPASWGPFGGDLLIGNFGDGLIQVFEEQPNGGFKHQGVLRDKSGFKIQIDGLWALEFAAGSAHGTRSTLSSTAGPNDESDGLFGTIVPIT